MSNQQPGYPQQPPYGPQYGGYPPPPQPPRRSKAGLVVACVVGALVLIAGGIFVVSQVAGGSDDAADDTVGTTEPVASAPRTSGRPTAGGLPSAPPEQPTQPAQPTEPVRPAAGCDGCLPGVTLKSLVLALKAKGFTCKLDRRWECNRGTIDVYVDPDYKKKLYAESIDIGGGSSAKVQNCPQCIKGAVAALKQGLPGVLPLFVKDASVRQQIVTFAMQGAGIPASGPSSARDAKVGGYRLSTQGYSGASVGKNGRYASFYSTSVTIRGVSEY